jgi:phosphatidylglycerol:prolipoprotein diacylglycerol transferase
LPEREAFRIGDIVVHWYGIMIMLGVLLASYLSIREARRRREDPDHVWQLFPWVLIAGILGARLGWVIPSLGSLSQEPLAVFGAQLPWQFRIFAIWEGGLSIQGAVIGGALAVWLYCRGYRLRFLKWADIIVPGLAVAQAIGRWGNFFNQEAFGTPTTLPWGIPISTQRQREVAGQEFGTDVRFHPTFAYEMVWDLLNFFLLMWLGRQRRFRLLEGDLLWIYLIFYSVGRIAIEQIRVDSALVGGLRAPQIVALLTIAFAWTMFIYRRRSGSNARLSETNLPYGERLPDYDREDGTGRRIYRVPKSTRPASDATMSTTTTQQSGNPESAPSES